jgi:hypothetical protein
MGLSGHDTVVLEDQVDEELAALMREQHDDQMDSLLSQLKVAPTTAATPLLPAQPDSTAVATAAALEKN